MLIKMSASSLSNNDNVNLECYFLFVEFVYTYIE